ncbi:MAG TPA: hypothetical protein VI248_26310 [Kineosporiaceae bacterium]
MTTFNISSAHADPPLTAPMKGKTWEASIYQMVVQWPYVQVAGVLDLNKPADIPKLRWYYVLPQSNWVVDCKYYHPTMGWMYRGTRIQGITDAGGPFDGYYETGYMATILKNGLKLADVDELCFPGGDAGAPAPGRP